MCKAFFPTNVAPTSPYFTEASRMRGQEGRVSTRYRTLS